MEGKKLLVVVVVAFMLVKAGAIEKHFSLESHGGYAGGSLSEIIYQPKDCSKKISLLEWDRNIFCNYSPQKIYKKLTLPTV